MYLLLMKLIWVEDHTQRKYSDHVTLIVHKEKDHDCLPIKSAFQTLWFFRELNYLTFRSHKTAVTNYWPILWTSMSWRFSLSLATNFIASPSISTSIPPYLALWKWTFLVVKEKKMPAFNYVSFLARFCSKNVKKNISKHYSMQIDNCPYIRLGHFFLWLNSSRRRQLRMIYNITVQWRSGKMWLSEVNNSYKCN